MADKIDKVWGTTEALLRSPLFEMHRLVIKPRHRCSFHTHRYKHNAFFVIEGLLFIDSALHRDGPKETICLSQYGVYTILPGVWHQFRTQSAGCRALEMYFTEPLSEDIVRSNIGGVA